MPVRGLGPFLSVSRPPVAARPEMLQRWASRLLSNCNPKGLTTQIECSQTGTERFIWRYFGPKLCYILLGYLDRLGSESCVRQPSGISGSCLLDAKIRHLLILGDIVPLK